MSRKSESWLLGAGDRRLAFEPLETRRMLTTITVTTASDAVAHAGTSLRDAITTANADAANGTSDTINFSPGVEDQTIALSQGALILGSSGKEAGTITIDATSSPVAISGQNATQVFEIQAGLTAKFDGFTITGGSATGLDGGGINNAGTLTLQNCAITASTATVGSGAGGSDGLGGGIYNSGTLTLSTSAVTGCAALPLTGGNTTTNGGGIYSTGSLFIDNASVITQNSQGGGIVVNLGTITVQQGSSITGNVGIGLTIENVFATSPDFVTNSNVSGNTLGGIKTGLGTPVIVSGSTVNGNTGSGIYNDGLLTLENSTVGSNVISNGTFVFAAQGAGVNNSLIGTATISDSTIANNLVTGTGNGEGGGVYNDGNLTISNSTISGNQALASQGGESGQGGGVYNDANLTITNSTIASNTANITGAGAGAVGGGLFSVTPSGAIQPTVTLINTLIAQNVAPIAPDINAVVTAGNNNLIGIGSGEAGLTNGANGNLVGGAGAAAINPVLGPLANNGGTTLTMALNLGSPAIGAAGSLTTVVSAASASAAVTTISVTNAAAIASTQGSFYIDIDNEEMLVTNVDLQSSPNTITVQRAVGGTTLASIKPNDLVYLATDQIGQPRPIPADIGALEYEPPNSGPADVSINSVTESSGPSGQTAFTFTVSLSKPVANIVTVDYATADGSATVANNDYVATSGTLMFAAGQTTASIVVEVNGSTRISPNLNFYVNLSNLTGAHAILQTSQGVGTIIYNSHTPPDAMNDSASLYENQSTTIDVLANDTDSDGTIDPSTVTIVTKSSNGTAVVNATTGVVSYTPNTNFVGSDSFTYTVADTQGAISNVATVSITVMLSNAPFVGDTRVQTAINTPITIDLKTLVTANNNNLDPTSFRIVNAPSNGAAVLGALGLVTYTPNTGFTGGDAFTFRAASTSGLYSNIGTVTIITGPVGSVSGYVYLDANNDGVKESNEMGLGNVTVTLLKTDGAFTFTSTTTTASNGSYTFGILPAGVYTLDVTQPAIYTSGKDTPGTAGAAGPSANGQIANISLPTGVNATGYEFGESGYSATLLQLLYTRKLFFASASQDPSSLNLSAGAQVVALGPSLDGAVVVQAAGNGVGSVQLQLLNSSMQVMESSSVSSSSSLTFTGSVNQEYYVELSGTSTAASMQTSIAPTPQWHNAAMPLDVTGDGKVEPLDALIEIRLLDSPGGSSIAQDVIPPGEYPDVLGTGQLTPMDALRIIQALNANSGSASADVASSSGSTASGSVATTAGSQASSGAGQTIGAHSDGLLSFSATPTIAVAAEGPTSESAFAAASGSSTGDASSITRVATSTITTLTSIATTTAPASTSLPMPAKTSSLLRDLSSAAVDAVMVGRSYGSDSRSSPPTNSATIQRLDASTVNASIADELKWLEIG